MYIKLTTHRWPISYFPNKWTRLFVAKFVWNRFLASCAQLVPHHLQRLWHHIHTLDQSELFTFSTTPWTLIIEILWELVYIFKADNIPVPISLLSTNTFFFWMFYMDLCCKVFYPKVLYLYCNADLVESDQDDLDISPVCWIHLHCKACHIYPIDQNSMQDKVPDYNSLD